MAVPRETGEQPAGEHTQQGGVQMPQHTHSPQAPQPGENQFQLSEAELALVWENIWGLDEPYPEDIARSRLEAMRIWDRPFFGNGPPE